MTKDIMEKMDLEKIQGLAKLIRYYILTSTTAAGSGHPTSSLSATDLMTVLFFGNHLRFDFDNPDNPANDRLVFSKGHATPLFYALYLAAGQITPEEISQLRKFDSPLEGHPTLRFKFTEAATGSLGQGLSVGVGLALGQKSLRLRSGQALGVGARTFVLLGDGEMAEGSMWEAINLASHYKLDNLTAVLDVNRLGQSQETMLGWDTKTYKERFEAFGWKTIVINGHEYSEIEKAYNETIDSASRPGRNKPLAIIAKTVKGKGVPLIENKDGWHGKPLKEEELKTALEQLGKVDLKIRGKVVKPVSNSKVNFSASKGETLPDRQAGLRGYKLGDEVATRKAYGKALARLGTAYPQVVSLDGDVKNSTYAEIFKEAYPERFYEMFIAEQNMAGAAVGMARLGFIPFVSSFACFLTRAFDQIRMAGIGQANVKFCGSHAGVSIGEDGPSQMGLEDLSMFKTIQGSVVCYPADAVSTEKLVEEMIKYRGICYLRTSRPTTAVIYENNEKFPIGGCKIHRSHSAKASRDKKVIIVAAGVTLFEALKAQEMLLKDKIEAIVVDAYSIKPIDEKSLMILAKETPNFITVEDHYPEGGLGDSVLNVFKNGEVKIKKLAVYKAPRSGKTTELLAFEEIDAQAIIKSAKRFF